MNDLYTTLSNTLQNINPNYTVTEGADSFHIYKDNKYKGSVLHDTDIFTKDDIYSFQVENMDKEAQSVVYNIFLNLHNNS